jgi:hypothetical protein
VLDVRGQISVRTVLVDELSANIEHRQRYVFLHPVSEVISAIAATGLRIEFFHEFPFTTDAFSPLFEAIDGKKARLKEHADSIPLLYSVKATRPA